MTRRSSLVVLLALAVGCGGGAVPVGSRATPAPVARSAPPRFGAGNGVYRYLRADTIIQTLPNGGTNQAVVERRILFRWATTPEAGGFALTLTLDSVRLFTAGGAPVRAFEDSARGAVIRGHLSPEGHLTGLTATPASRVTNLFLANLPWLVPTIPATLDSAGLIDTSEATVWFGVVDLQERTIRRSVAGEAVGSISQRGAVTSDGVAPNLHFTGSGARWGTATLAPSGRLLEATGRDSVAMAAEVATIGQTVQLMRIGGYTLTALP